MNINAADDLLIRPPGSNDARPMAEIGIGRRGKRRPPQPPGRAVIGMSDGRRRKPMSLSLLRPALAAILSLIAFHCATAQDALKVAIGQRGGWEQCVSELGQNAGIFKKHGLALELL